MTHYAVHTLIPAVTERGTFEWAVLREEKLLHCFPTRRVVAYVCDEPTAKDIAELLNEDTVLQRVGKTVVSIARPTKEDDDE